MYTKVLLAIFVALPLLADCRPSHCERWRGDSQFRCAKDNYGEDRIKIRNIIGNTVTFKIGKWVSQCGRKGVNHSDQMHTLGPYSSMDEPFSEAKSGICNELFVYDCNRDGNRVSCLNVVSVYPN